MVNNFAIRIIGRRLLIMGYNQLIKCNLGILKDIVSINNTDKKLISPVVVLRYCHFHNFDVPEIFTANRSSNYYKACYPFHQKVCTRKMEVERTFLRNNNRKLSIYNLTQKFHSGKIHSWDDLEYKH